MDIVSLFIPRMRKRLQAWTCPKSMVCKTLGGRKCSLAELTECQFLSPWDCTQIKGLVSVCLYGSNFDRYIKVFLATMPLVQHELMKRAWTFCIMMCPLTHKKFPGLASSLEQTGALVAIMRHPNIESLGMSWRLLPLLIGLPGHIKVLFRDTDEVFSNKTIDVVEAWEASAKPHLRYDNVTHAFGWTTFNIWGTTVNEWDRHALLQRWDSYACQSAYGFDEIFVNREMALETGCHGDNKETFLWTCGSTGLPAGLNCGLNSWH